MLDRHEQQALRRIAGHHGGSGFTAFADAVLRVERQPSLRFSRLRRMTLVAVLHQHRTDLRLEKCDTIIAIRVDGDEQHQEQARRLHG